MALTGVEHGGRKDSRRHAVTSRQLVHEVAQQKRYFFLALAQGRHVHGECAQPVVKIFAQLSIGNGLFHIDLGRGQYACVHLDRVLGAGTRKMSVSQNVQQLGLQAERHFGDLIQKQRAALTQFQLAGLGLSFSCDRSEEFALEHVTGQRRAIQFKEAKAGADRQFVNQTGRQVLAAAILSLNENRRARPEPAVPPGPAVCAWSGWRRRRTCRLPAVQFRRPGFRFRIRRCNERESVVSRFPVARAATDEPGNLCAPSRIASSF